VTFGEAVTRWSVRLATLCMIAAWLLMLRRRDFSAKIVWTLGFAAYLVHLWAAFEYFHHWSHSAAVAETARQTKELVGLDWGGGVLANYLFTLVWGSDVAWWWISPESHHRRSIWTTWAVHGCLGFIAFNATIVFASGFSPWLGIAGCLAIAAVGRALPAERARP
jgi:hypothetical protein